MLELIVKAMQGPYKVWPSNLVGAQSEEQRAA